MDTSSMVRLADIAASGIEDAGELAEYGATAEAFLLAHNWCRQVRQGYPDFGWAGILALFTFEFEPVPPCPANAVWVVVGDVPPAYIAVDDCPNGALALKEYVDVMGYSLDHAREGTHPADAAPICYRNSTRPLDLTPELLDMLASRLEFIEEKLLPELAGTDAAPSPSRL